MTSTRDRCRLCFTLLARRDRSICCQKFYQLFKPIERRQFSSLKLKNPLSTTTTTTVKTFSTHRTVCFHDLIRRYLHISLKPSRNASSIICSECSIILLEVEQCAKSLRKTINQLKMKLTKTNRLQTSSLFATFQKKSQTSEELLTIHEERLSSHISDSEEDFSQQSQARTSTHHPNTNNGQCNDIDDDDEDDGMIDEEADGDDDNEDDDEKGLVKPSTSNGYFCNPNNIKDERNLNHMQTHLAQMMVGQPQQPMDPTMNAIAHLQRNLLFQFFNDPIATAQAAQAAAAAAAALSATPTKADILSKTNNHNNNNNKPMGSGRKRKSTPEKRVVTSHGDASPMIDQETLETTTVKNQELLDHPLELTLKSVTPTKSTSHIQNLIIGNSTMENDLSSYASHSTIDEGHLESVTPNDSSLSFSPPLARRPIPTNKRPKLSSTNITFDPLKTLPTIPADLLSPNHQTVNIEESNLLGQGKQARKLDPRTCAECGKTLFSDKTHLTHCQTHAKNEKQCWICGIQDDDIKKHILSEHANQKFTPAGFKCQHCEKVFPIFSDLENHIREHTKKKPFECPICHKRFGQQGNLSCHLRIHSGVKPFTCASCGKAFRHSNSLRRHARTVHSASRGLTMSPASMASSTTTPSSLLMVNPTTSNSMLTMANHHLSSSEGYDDGTSSGLLIVSDEGESYQDQGSPSTGGDAPSPSNSNAQMDSDSPEQSGTG